MILSPKNASALLTLLVLGLPAFAQENPSKQKWIKLFNGKNLDGWKVKIAGHKVGDNHNNTFRVEKGILKVGYDKYNKFNGKFGHLFYEKPFSHYIIRVEYRFTGKQVPGAPSWALRNSGVMIHGQTPESMHLKQKFPVSIEVQLLGGNGTDKRSTANLCTPGTNVVMNGKLEKRHCIDSKSMTYHGEQWVTVEVEVRGNKSIKHKVNGKTVMTYSGPQLDERDADAKGLLKTQGKMLDRGTISLQSESHPIEFRKVELLVLNQ